MNLQNYGMWMIINDVMKSMLSLVIPDVAVTKRHQRRDEIRIFFTRTSSKSCTPSTLNATLFAQHTLAINTCISHSIRLLKMHTFPTEKLLC